jgi:hypothetical protein
MRNRHERFPSQALFSSCKPPYQLLATREPGRHRNMLHITNENFPAPDQPLGPGCSATLMAGTVLY